METKNEHEKFDFLYSIHGDEIPEDLRKTVLPNGVTVYSDGKPNVKKIVEMTLDLMSKRHFRKRSTYSEIEHNN